MGNFLIGKVTKIFDREQVIEAEVGTEFKVKAYPLWTLQQVVLEDEVLLVKVSEQFDTYMYLLLRLNAEFKYKYNQMLLGFNDEKSIIIKAPEINIEGNVNFKGAVKFKEGSVFLESNNGKEVVGAFNTIKECPILKLPHSKSYLAVNPQKTEKE